MLTTCPTCRRLTWAGHLERLDDEDGRTRCRLAVNNGAARVVQGCASIIYSDELPQIGQRLARADGQVMQPHQLEQLRGRLLAAPFN